VQSSLAFHAKDGEIVVITHRSWQNSVVQFRKCLLSNRQATMLTRTPSYPSQKNQRIEFTDLYLILPLNNRTAKWKIVRHVTIRVRTRNSLWGQVKTVQTLSIQYWPKVTHAKNKRTSHPGCNACDTRFRRVLHHICYSNVARLICTTYAWHLLRTIF
jgi:hypothetical protein